MKNVDRRTGSIERMLAAALEILQENGYARFRVADVSARSQTSQGLLFRYFPTKNDVVTAALERAFAYHLDRLSEAFVAMGPSPSRKAIMAALWEVLNHDELRWTYELYAAAGHDRALQAVVGPVIELHGQRIDELALAFSNATGVMPVGDLRMAVNLVTWSMQGLVLNDLARSESGRVVALIDYLDELAAKAYGALDR